MHALVINASNCGDHIRQANDLLRGEVKPQRLNSNGKLVDGSKDEHNRLAVLEVINHTRQQLRQHDSVEPVTVTEHCVGKFFKVRSLVAAGAKARPQEASQEFCLTLTHTEQVQGNTITATAIAVDDPADEPAAERECREALAAANKKAVSEAAEVLEGVSIDSDSSDVDSIDCAESPVVRQQLREAKFQLGYLQSDLDFKTGQLTKSVDKCIELVKKNKEEKENNDTLISQLTELQLQITEQDRLLTDEKNRNHEQHAHIQVLTADKERLLTEILAVQRLRQANQAGVRAAVDKIYKKENQAVSESVSPATKAEAQALERAQKRPKKDASPKNLFKTA